MDFLAILESFGFPAAVVIGSGLGIWHIVIWCGDNLAKPLIAAHVSFLEKVLENVEDLTNASKEQTPILQELNATAKKTAHQTAEHLKNTADDRTKLAEVHETIVKGACRFTPPPPTHS